MDLEEIRKEVARTIEAQNNRGIPEFMGYSPAEFTPLLYDTFGTESPIRLQRLSDADCDRVPMLNQIAWLIDYLKRNNGVKLTAKGFLPTKVVAELYAQGFLKDRSIESGISKLYKEEDSITVHLSKLLLELSGLTKKRKGVLSLKKNAEGLIRDRNALLQLIFRTHAEKFNWPYFDGYEDNGIGQTGFGFSLVLLALFGGEKHLNTFYAEKYFEAFPMLYEGLDPIYRTVEAYAANVWSIRTLDRFLAYYGLMDHEEESPWFETVKFVSPSDLFRRFISFTAPQSVKE